MIDGISGLKGALGYVRAYRGKAFVVKVGGEVLGDDGARDALAAQIGLLHSLGIRCVLVHGGGPQATALSRRLGIEPSIVAGRRITDDAQLEIAKMAFAGTVHVDLLAALRRSHVAAVGLTGVDAELLTASRRPPRAVRGDDGVLRQVDFGHVGEIERVDVTVLTTLLAAGFVPVVSSLAGDADGYGLQRQRRHGRREDRDRALGREAAHPHRRSGRPPRPVRSQHDRQLRGRLRPGDAGALRRDLGRDAARRSRPAFVRPKAASSARTSWTAARRTRCLVEVFTGAGCGTMIVRRKDKEAYADAELVR